MVVLRENDLAGLSELLGRRRGHLHFAGVCGVGMAGLAALLRDAGFDVSGCDVAPGRLAAWLEGKGIEVSAGHAPAHIRADMSMVVRSAAVPVDTPEIQRARELGVPVFSRGEVLSRLGWSRLVAVGGTHGKTTTTAFIAQLLKHAGRDPTWCVGGRVSGCGCEGVSGSGAGGIAVVEADESDGTLALYRAAVAVVTNVEFDHMEHFGSVEEFRECFRSFIRGAGTVVYCGDDGETAGLVANGRRAVDDGKGSDIPAEGKRLVSYGFGDVNDVGADGHVARGTAQEFTLRLDGVDCGRVVLNVPGRHNVLNALAAAAVALELGVTPLEVIAGLAEVRLPGRRFETVVLANDVRVVSDYAHHPSEVAALMGAVNCLGARRVLSVFQPHRYTRTLALGRDFPGSFAGVDELVLVPVYAASEQPLAGGSVWDLYAEFREAGSVENVVVGKSLRQAWEYIRQRLVGGDVFLVVGAGDVDEIVGWARDEMPDGGAWDAACLRDGATDLANSVDGLTIRFDEQLAGKTTFGVGGTADIWAEIRSHEGLARLLTWCLEAELPFHLLGAGSNVLVSDLGVRGVTGRLTGDVFGSIHVTSGSAAAGAGVRAGAAVPISKLLDRLEGDCLSGLEFMEGIPGTVGGALRMNAGAAGDEICRHVSWIRCLNMDGRECIVNRGQLQFGYRFCRSLNDCIVLEAEFEVTHGDPVGVAARRRDARERRRWMSGLRCAGSVFRNPPAADAAGRLIERAGLKGARIGGAVVSDRHANVIVTERGARASDVSALIEKVRRAVVDMHGVSLESEIVDMG